MRLNISLPQASLLNSARGYIPPEEWDEGYLPHPANYSFTGSREQTAIAIFESAERVELYRRLRAQRSPELFGKGRLSFATLTTLALARAIIPLKANWSTRGTAPGTMFSTASASRSAAYLSRQYVSR